MIDYTDAEFAEESQDTKTANVLLNEIPLNDPRTIYNLIILELNEDKVNGE